MTADELIECLYKVHAGLLNRDKDSEAAVIWKMIKDIKKAGEKDD